MEAIDALSGESQGLLERSTQSPSNLERVVIDWELRKIVALPENRTSMATCLSVRQLFQRGHTMSLFLLFIPLIILRCRLLWCSDLLHFKQIVMMSIFERRCSLRCCCDNRCAELTILRNYVIDY